MEYIIYPDIFDATAKAFFTGRDPGVDVRPLVGGSPICMPRQEHTCEVMVAGPEACPQVADAVITSHKGVFLGVQVADCVPILLHDRNTPAIGAVHAGWRGTARGILKEALREMKEKFGSSLPDMAIAIGPAIRWCCYQVGKEVLEAVAKETGDGEYHTERDGGLCLDLPSANKYQALSMGVPEEHVWMSEECTYCYPDKFYSYRYSKGPTGRQGGFIGMP